VPGSFQKKTTRRGGKEWSGRKWKEEERCGGGGGHNLYQSCKGGREQARDKVKVPPKQRGEGLGGGKKKDVESWRNSAKIRRKE